MPNSSFEHDPVALSRKWTLVVLISFMLAAAVLAGAAAAYLIYHDGGGGLFPAAAILIVVPALAYLLYKKTIFPYYRRLEDANLELHIKQEELLDTKDDLFIKFLGIYDVNYAANSPRLFAHRLKDVADISARVMEADECLIYLYDKKGDDLTLAAANDDLQGAVGKVRMPLGEGIEGWVGRRLEPVMLKDFRRDARFHEIPGLDLSGYLSIYCLPLYVYSNGALVGVMEALYGKPKSFTDEDINFFTTLSGIISTTIQNEQMQTELRKMNMELEQWVAEKTEELRASEERYRTLVENAYESIFVLAENGDIVFANEQATRLTGFGKYDLIHKNLFELFVHSASPQDILSKVSEGRQSVWHGELRKADGTGIPVDMVAAGLTLMNKRFVQAVILDMSAHAHLEKLLEEKERETADLKARLKAGN